MEKDEINRGLCAFLKASPSPFHAVASLSKELESAGYQRLDEADTWQLSAGHGYYLTRNDSSLIAFSLSGGDLSSQGFNMIGAHTDSPCLKLKPETVSNRQGYAQLGVEVYGGALLNPWFDRDLSIAGRVTYLNKSGKLASCLIDFERAVATVPSLAIHLDREVNNSRSINAQKHLPPVFLQLNEGQKLDFKALLLAYIQENTQVVDIEKVVDHELSLYDVQAAATLGFNNEFLAGARLDNLLSCYIGLQSMLKNERKTNALLFCSDHEEVGSGSAAGAGGPFLEAVLDRIVEKLGTGNLQENKRRMLHRSRLLSVDNAHGIHPNYADRHDEQHGPLLNKGPVLKINANQRYASNSESSAHFRTLCEEINVPLQSFVVRSDMACGSTIGPIVAAELGIKTLDIGVPTFAMHSIRELAGSMDTFYLAKALTHFLGRQ